MGNILNNKKSFITQLIKSSSYRDFIIKMNQMISRGTTDWSWPEEITADEIT